MNTDTMREKFYEWASLQVSPMRDIPSNRDMEIMWNAYVQGQRDLIEAMEQVGVIYHEYVYLNRSMESMTKTTRKNVMKKSVPVYRLPEGTQK